MNKVDIENVNLKMRPRSTNGDTTSQNIMVHWVTKPKRMPIAKCFGTHAMIHFCAQNCEKMGRARAYTTF